MADYQYKSKYTRNEIDARLERAGNVSNPWLNDNGYFGNPVNQRGFSGQNTSGGYFLDRLLGYNCSYADGVLIIKKGMFDKSVNGYIIQRVEPSRSKYLNGKLCTFSAIVDGDLICGTAAYSNTSKVTYTNENGVRLYTQVASGLVELVAVTDQPVEKAILAWKIELGTQQTLAHQDENGKWQLNELPNYADELARCQLYRRQFNAYTKFVAQYIDGNKIVFVLPVSMRTAPSMSGAWKIFTGFTEQIGFTLNTYQTGNIIVVEAVKKNHGLSSAWLGVDSSGVGILNAEL